MDEIEHDCLADNPDWLKVLQLYAEKIDQPRGDDEQGVRWIERIEQLDDLSAEQVSEIHGQLIAQGWLTFQLEGRQSGLLYRLTNLGRGVYRQFAESGCSDAA